MAPKAATRKQIAEHMERLRRKAALQLSAKLCHIRRNKVQMTATIPTAPFSTASQSASEGCPLTLAAAPLRAGGYPFPFDNGSVVALFTSIGKGEYTIPDGTGPVLEALLRGILTVDYEHRFSIEQIVTHE